MQLDRGRQARRPPWVDSWHLRAKIMAKKPSPWFWEARDSWYITRNGQHVNLGKHPADSPLPSKRNGKWVVPDLIMQAFYTAMTSNPEVENPPSTAPSGPTVAEIFEKYLAWCKQHRESALSSTTAMDVDNEP